MKNKIIVIIQPILTSYRKKLFDELTDSFNKVDIYSIQNVGNGFKSDIEGKFKTIHTQVIGSRTKVYYQKGIILAILKNKPTAIFVTADFRAVHYFLILLVAKILKIPIFSHGQGLYNKPNPSLIHRLLFNYTIGLSSSYVCYTDSVYRSLISIGINRAKLSVMDNTIVNEFPLKPSDKSTITDRLLYIGRLRESSNLELLFEALKILKSKSHNVGLDIIGDGIQRSMLEDLSQTLNLDICFHGAIYDDEKITELSQNSTIGVYPGDAGLSLVHYMSLSLVPIVHDNLTKHMGPEPSYIKHGINGLTFERNDAKSLAKTIETLLGNESMIKKLSRSAFDTYMSLSKPTMAEKLIEIMKPYLKENITI